MENSFTTAPLVCLRDVVVRDINRDDQVVRSATGDRVLILPRWITRAFLHCVAFAPLPQHLAREARLFKWTEAQVRTAASHFTRALEAGFFLAQGDVLAVSQHREKPGTIAFIGVPTCNRVDSLMRMIRSMVQHENPFHTTLSFVVMDDSSDSHKRQRVRDALHWLKNELGFHVAYAGLEEKSAWAQQLAETSGVERMIVDYGLFDVLETHANQPGSNRNALLLHGAEDMFLSCDDDLVIPPSGFCQPTRLTWQTAGDPTQFRFAPPATSGEEASPDLSLLNYHERYLGREIAFIQHDIPGAGIDVRGPGRHCLPTSYGLSPFVVSTWTGFSGDCGMSALSPLLTLATHNHAPPRC